MKTAVKLLVFSFFLVTFSLFSDMHLVLAQNADDVNVTDERSVAAFVTSAKDRFAEVGVQFRKQAKDRNGPWKSESKNLYLILVDNDNKSAFLHAGDQEAESRDLTVFEDFVSLVDMASEEPVCLRYDGPEVMGRYACAIITPVLTRTGATLDRILIGGFHHEKLPEENLHDLPYGDYEPDTKASDVVDAETLKNFVEEAVYALENDFGRGGLVPDSKFRPVFRRADGPWRRGDIYIFIMLDNSDVIFNANDPALEDTSLDITDINNCNVGEEIIRVIRGQDRECLELGLLPENPEGFVEYRWDNPDDPNDDDLRFKEGGRLDLSPGTTPKLSYVKSFRSPLGSDFIVGSGVYPQDTTTQEESNGGCVIAGDDANPKSAASNLILIALFLVTAISLKNRSRRKYPA